MIAREFSSNLLQSSEGEGGAPVNRFGAIFRRAVKILLLVELGYLLLANLALQLPLTQDIVNLVRPEKFHVRWDSAWTWYPFRVHARGVSANGQSRSQQWQLDVGSASGSVSLLPLVLKRVYVRNLRVSGVEYRQRPRLKPDRDYSAILDHFPPIEGREIAPADTSPRNEKRPWKVWINNASNEGDVGLWIYNLQGSLRGSAVADLAVESRGGPFSLDARELDLQLFPAYLNGDAEIFNGGTLTGELGFSPFIPRENKGLRLLPHLWLDTLLDLQVKGLGFINLFTGNLGDFNIRGAGRVSGSLKYAQGFVLAGTDLLAEAENLSLDLREMNVLGQGSVRISTPEDQDKPLTLAIGYDELSVTRDGDSAPFLRGESLQLAYGGSNYIVPRPGLDLDTFMNDEEYRKRRENNTLLIDIEDATLVNMAIINDYLPAGAGLAFTTGSALLQADVDARAEDVRGGLQLQGSDIGMELDGQELQGDLAVDLVITGGTPREFRLQLDGSSITLNEVRVAGANQRFDDAKWAATVLFDRAEAVADNPPFLSADARLKVSDTGPLVALFDNHGDPPRWVSRQLLLKDIEGQASVELQDKRLQVDKARVLSDKAELAAKAVFYQTGRDGVIYARYRKLDLLLKMTGEKGNLDVFRAREKFEAYRLTP